MSDCTDAAETTDEGTEPRAWRGPAALRALRHRDFSLFWCGLLVSATGSWMQNVAQGWLVFDLTHSKFYLGLVGAMGTLPVLLLTLPSGVIADRFNKRKITIVTQSAAMVLAFALAALAYTGVIEPWHIVAIAALSGAVNALDIPARQSLTIELVGKEDLLNAVALNSSAFNGARIVGPAVAGVILATSGAAACFLFNGISYLAVIVGLAMIRSSRLRAGSSAKPMLAEIREGLHFARGHALIRDLLLMTAVASIFALQYSTLMPALAKDVLGVGPEGLGILMAAAGLGALSAALAVAGIGHRFRQGTIVTVGSILAPVGLVALSMSHSYPVSIVCLVLVGFGMMMFLAVSNSIVQTASPDALRGRMLSVRTLVFMGLAPIGSLQIGVAAQYLGVQPSLRIGGMICIVAAVCFAVRSTAVRGAR